MPLFAESILHASSLKCRMIASTFFIGRLLDSYRQIERIIDY